jgi:hypothetical protein
MGNEENKSQKQPYEKPTATKLTREQAKLKLMGYVMMGNGQAKELLEILFQQETFEKQPYEKPTATQLTREQARLKLIGHAMMGSKEALKLLDTLFENKKRDNNDTKHKQSA